MSGIDRWKEAMKTPPDERLAGIEYRAHFLNILGVLVVSIILTLKGFWYIVFALIFNTGVSYSQGMSAYGRWRIIRGLRKDVPIEKEISITRKRSRIVKTIFGEQSNWMASIISVIVAMLIINPAGEVWYVYMAFIMLIFFLWIIIYFFVMYYISLIFYNRNKGGE